MKPRIIVLSKDDADCFEWVSDGWNYKNIRNTEKAKTLWAKANKAIKEGKYVPGAIRLLEEAGFQIARK